MFSLLIVVISIAIVTAITLAVMYYGGSEVQTKGQDHSLAARGLNEIAQIRTAILAYQISENSNPSSLQDLVDGKYIGSIPDGWSDKLSDSGEVIITTDSISLGDETRDAHICSLINDRLGVHPVGESPPSCSAVPDGFLGCCVSSE